MSLFRSRSGSAPADTSEKGPTIVFETDGRILYEVDSSVLSQHPIVIGRDKSCDWCTAGIDGSVSSRHAEIVRRRGSVWIRDLGSRNGLYVRGERVKEHRLATNEPVLIGACKVTLEPAQSEKISSGAAFHRLEQRNGPESGRVFELKGDSDLVIGSDPGSDIFVPDTLVSRQHAKLSFKKDGSCWISDLGSRNGTSVDGMAVAKEKERLLRDGNILSVAYVEFRFFDKDAVHVRAHVGAKLLVAAATVAVGVIAYSFWNLVRPEAGRLLYRAERDAASWTPDSGASDFASAFAFLDQAAIARGSDKHAPAHAELKARMEAWTNTISGWQTVRASLSSNLWQSARERFHDLSAWTWPSPTAAPAHHEAEAVQALVNAFLKGRGDLRREDWKPGELVPVFRADADELEKALSAAPEADEKAHKYVKSLRFESEDLAAEFRHATNIIESVSTFARTLRIGDSGNPPDSDVATRALDELRNALVAEKRHEDLRTEEKTEKKRLYPFFSPLVSTRLAAAIPPLEALADGERQVESNVAAIATARWGEVRRNLEFPSRAITDADRDYQAYRSWLVAKNAQFCGTDDNPNAGMDSDYRRALDDFKEKGFGPFLSHPTNALHELLDIPGILHDAFMFVDPETTPPPPADNSKWVCSYDRFVGIVAFSDFLGALKSGKTAAEAVDVYDAKVQRLPWKPVIYQARVLLEDLRRFVRRPEQEVFKHPDSGYSGPILRKPWKVVADARPADGRPNRVAEALENAQTLLDRVEDWCSDTLSDVATDRGSPRAQILAEGIEMLLLGKRELASEVANEKAGELGAKAKNLLADINRSDRDRSYIVNNGVPDKNKPYIGAWRYLYENAGREAEP